MLTAVVGINWGDEGKGRMVDLLSSEYDIVARYQGGNNAGHTIVTEKGKIVLNLVPSGILRENAVNIMGQGMTVDLEHLTKETEELRSKGVKVGPENLIIADGAVICMPYHKKLDVLEETRLAGKKFGSTQRGIGPSYSDRYIKKVIRMRDLLHPETLRAKLDAIVEWKNLIYVGGYGQDPISADEMYDWLMKFGTPFIPYIKNVSDYLAKAAAEGKNIMFEAQLGALRDIDLGIVPYTTSSSTIAAYAPIGAGIPGSRLDHTVGIMKAYSSCVGEGPFTCELFDETGELIRKEGAEYGAATGRPRRVGGFDVVASKYGCLLQGADDIALTKLDVLSALDQIPVVTEYIVNGEKTTVFPLGDDLNDAKPVYEFLPGWKKDITECRKFSDLPIEAQNYVHYIEKAVGCHIRWISVGAERSQFIEK